MAKQKQSQATKKNKKQQNNGSSNNNSTKAIQAEPQKAAGGPSLVWCFVVAFLALTLGVLTSPSFKGNPLEILQTATMRLLNYHQQQQNGVDDITNKNASLQQKQQHSYASCDAEALADFLHKDPVDGLHVVCVKKGVNNPNLWTMNVYLGAQKDQELKTLSLGAANGRSDILWSDLKQHLTTALQLRTQDELHQPWAVFTPFGERIVGEDEALYDPHQGKRVAETILDSGMILIFEGGQWLWPGVEEGFKREVDLYSIMPGGAPEGISVEPRKATLETLSLRPLVVAVEGFLTKDECEHIQTEATPKMSYSGVVLMDKDKDRPASDFRTSQSTFLRANKDDILRDVDYRTASLVRIPRSHQEHVQVLRYGYTEKYNAHHDYFNPEYYQNDPNTLRTIQNGKRNRLATVFWYLSDVEEGGETLFPRHNGGPQPRDLADCSVGLKVKPRTGKVIIFYSLTFDGTRDELSLHTACPVKEGVKWAANKWVWNLPMNYIRDK